MGREGGGGAVNGLCTTCNERGSVHASSFVPFCALFVLCDLCALCRYMLATCEPTFPALKTAQVRQVVHIRQNNRQFIRPSPNGFSFKSSGHDLLWRPFTTEVMICCRKRTLLRRWGCSCKIKVSRCSHDLMSAERKHLAAMPRLITFELAKS